MRSVTNLSVVFVILIPALSALAVSNNDLSFFEPVTEADIKKASIDKIKWMQKCVGDPKFKLSKLLLSKKRNNFKDYRNLDEPIRNSIKAINTEVDNFDRCNRFDNWQTEKIENIYEEADFKDAQTQFDQIATLLSAIHKSAKGKETEEQIQQICHTMYEMLVRFKLSIATKLPKELFTNCGDVKQEAFKERYNKKQYELK